MTLQRFNASFQRLGACLLAFLLAGCSLSGTLTPLADPQEQAAARHAIELLELHRFDELKALFAPQVDQAAELTYLRGWADLIPKAQAVSVTLASVQNYRLDGNSIRQLSFKVVYPHPQPSPDPSLAAAVARGELRLMIHVLSRQQDGKSQLVALRLEALGATASRSPREQPPASSRWVSLAATLGALAVAFNLHAIIVCVRSAQVGRKWLWLLCMLFGVGQLNLNWSLAQWSFDPLALNFMAMAPSLADGMEEGICVPLAALVFMLLRARSADRPAKSE